MPAAPNCGVNAIRNQRIALGVAVLVLVLIIVLIVRGCSADKTPGTANPDNTNQPNDQTQVQLPTTPNTQPSP